MKTAPARFGTFYALLWREFIEHRNLILIAPLVAALLLTLLLVWVMFLLPESFKQFLIDEAASWLTNLPLRAAVLIPVLLAQLFVPVLLLIWLIYLTVCLYQERKDRSFLFWQSMPVSDGQTVLAKVVTVVFVIPAVTSVFVFCWLLVPMFLVVPALPEPGVSSAWLRSLLLVFDGTLLFYCFAWLTGLLFMPVIGWFLLFSAYSRRVPFLWAAGSAIALALFEIWLLDSAWLGYWLDWPTNGYVFGWPDVPAALFSYEMLVALLLGSVLLTGAALMRRYND